MVFSSQTQRGNIVNIIITFDTDTETEAQKHKSIKKRNITHCRTFKPHKNKAFTG